MNLQKFLCITLTLSGFVPLNTVQFPQALASRKAAQASVAFASIAGLSLLNSHVRKFVKNFIVHSDENQNELRWNWDEIDTKNINFPVRTKNGEFFKWGAAICALQTEGTDQNTGLPHSNWAHWIQNAPKSLKLQEAGKACDSWTLYERDIEMLKELGLNCYRFSVDWSRIEPRQGEIDHAALNRYVEICNALNAAGIQPVVTLHHFVHPQWFEELGAFEKSENIKYFVNFSKLVFETLGDRVGLWCTINEPAIYAMQGYIRGVYPPGKMAGPLNAISAYKLAAEVLKNLLDAHVEIYHTLKQLPGGETAKIGIVHQYLKFERFHGTYSPLKAGVEYLIATSFDWVHKTVIDYFKTGTYSFCVRGICNVQDASQQKRRASSLDYIGLNYYSHPLIRIHHRLKDMVFPGQRSYDIETDMPLNVYAEGLYRAIKHVAELQVPIYITENGAPSGDNTVKDIWSHRYLYAMNKAIEEGYDIRGYMYWSLLHNYEWDMGYDIKFGLYNVDFASPDKTRTLTPGAEYFKQVMLAEKAKRDAFGCINYKPLFSRSC